MDELDDDILDGLRSADAAVKEVSRTVVSQRRHFIVLTWALLHEMEAEVLAELVGSGEHSPMIVNMLGAPEAMAYPKDSRVVSFNRHEFLPIVFGGLERAWNHLH